MNLSIYQIVGYVIINILGILCMYGSVLIFTKYKNRNISKIKASIFASLLTFIICLVVMADIGLYNWTKTGSNHEILRVIVLVICAIPILMPVFIVGSYIQLSYQDKIQQIVISKARKEQSKKQ